MTKNIYISLLKAVAKICIAGVFIGLLHHLDGLVALILAAKVVHSMYSLGFKDGQKYWLVPIGMILTGVLGISAENWGIENEYWQYHDVTTKMPLWLPFAWMLAFSYVYKLEKELFRELKKPSLITKATITFLLALIFPAFGEVITINLGVWTYSWPYQFLGVPLYALICLVIFHMFVNIFIYFIAHKAQLKDPVFNP
ncbi:hypothetical protein [Wenyingzhuangia sp. 2_MG-2023]|uniref:hypothetical protein n=1 Tax=Wenyingzhuangia sp. 2_MG-2023 TaxID=3062639 RepID=UPI0026E1BE61|nr:hypothetical protein [Wenyingzhuangia sp. 2_MG-2023]MDO6738783.1 hypothetical protein [Wenyingzhuangia sp. 2_MG-2023]